ncbi:palmitoyltransferase ZDHHC4 [Spea bombifrons]|uniref:palmitoyltransferase ZDHHC4 n=1 Tax=Spea bombifrons TaxID=233779 RepID=UPI00234B0295|nr:palmitoyltransferase ZDHHC4 [Spea bombifrons]
MDFLWLFTIYTIFLIICISAFCFLSARSRSSLDSVFHRAEKALSFLLPPWLQRCYSSYTRSGVFVALHLILDALVFAEYTWEVFDYCSELEINRLFLLLPYTLITANLFFFYKCCVTDPGVVTKQNEASRSQVYEYDEVLYHRHEQCHTCRLTKPARSKHCSVCGYCVQRFDHHCVWVNNCIGSLNIGYFLLYLFSLTLTVFSLAAVFAVFLLQVVLLSHMMTAAYVDSDGREQIMSIAVIIQHLFLTFPRIVFTLGFLLILILLLGGYGSFMFYLALTNQTTNEWFKAKRLSSTVLYAGYSRGLLANMQEIFQPHVYYKKGR